MFFLLSHFKCLFISDKRFQPYENTIVNNMISYDRNTAILLILFQRSDTTQKVFERIREVKPKRLYLAADGPRNEKERMECDATRAIDSCVDWDCEVVKLYQEQNLGCDTHCHQAISWFFEQEPEGIILEDDCVPSLSFFGFCTTLLEKYRNDERIGHITGGNYQFGKKRGDGSYYFSNLTHVGGWAGWRRVWKSICLYDKNYPLFERLNYLSNLPSHTPFQAHWNKYFGMANHNPDYCWDFRYAYTNVISNRLSIIPNHNLISNIGCSGKATHYIKGYPFADIENEEIDRITHPSFICPDIEADLYSQTKEYNSSWESLTRQDDIFYLKEKLNTIVINNRIKPRIPQIIHQIYEDLSGPPPSLIKISQSWKELNHGWEYRFWNKNDIDTFLETYYPDLIPIYRAFPYDVQRWDAIRYLILYKIGGLYVDMDYECTECITPLFCETECAMGMEPKGHATLRRMPYIVGNAFMATTPNHPYFKELINAVFHDDKDMESLSPELSILDSTGPYMTTRVYENSKHQERVSLIPAELIAPLTKEEVLKVVNDEISESLENKIEKSFAIHYFFGSWYGQARK